MPIYEYLCNACGHEFEEWQKISDVPVRTCPSCGKRKVERLVSLSAFHLKGSGWYVTDYAGKKNDFKSKKDSEGKKETEGKKDTEAKAEKKESSKSAPHTDSHDKSSKKAI
jgi:putative FmdB family regulatory protein